MKKKLAASLLAAALTVSALAGCGGNSGDSAQTATGSQTGQAQETGSVQETESAPETESAQEAESAQETGDAGGEVTLRLFSNLPDRKNGQGLVEQMIIDEYTAANPNVKIEVEALDEEAYKTKFKAYAMSIAMGVMPASFMLPQRLNSSS